MIAHSVLWVLRTYAEAPARGERHAIGLSFAPFRGSAVSSAHPQLTLWATVFRSCGAIWAWDLLGYSTSLHVTNWVSACFLLRASSNRS